MVMEIVVVMGICLLLGQPDNREQSSIRLRTVSRGSNRWVGIFAALIKAE
jgi:hypothetical protein